MIAILAAEHVDAARTLLARHGESSHVIGEVRRGSHGVVVES